MDEVGIIDLRGFGIDDVRSSGFCSLDNFGISSSSWERLGKDRVLAYVECVAIRDDMDIEFIVIMDDPMIYESCLYADPPSGGCVDTRMYRNKAMSEVTI